MIESLRDFLGGGQSGDRRRRSRVGLLLSILMLPVLLGVMGCFELPAPIGDPEKSRIDPAMNGIWLAESGDLEGMLMIFEPYDKRTWLVRWLILENKHDGEEDVDAGEQDATAETPETNDSGEDADGQQKEEETVDAPGEGVVDSDERTPLEMIADGDVYADGVALFKTWRTRISGKSFITMEFRVDISSDEGMKPRIWWGARTWFIDDDRLALHFIDNGFDEVQEANTRRELERVVRRNHENSELYIGDEPTVLMRVPPEYYDDIADIIEYAGLAATYD